MSPPLTYGPAYCGLFAALSLATACNAYLDIRHGSFGFEMACWSLLHAGTLFIAWRQNGSVDARGVFWQKVCGGLALLLTVLLFIPIWGFPRAGLYALAALQAAANCVTVDRRKFMLALLTSAVMAVFAAAHYRAEWTMLFYLVPYLFAVVLTLVAEQAGWRVREVQRDGVRPQLAGGQAACIVAASVSLLALAVLLFVLTPQVTWIGLTSPHGQLSRLGWREVKETGADGGRREQGGAGRGDETTVRAGGAGGLDAGGDQDLAHGRPGQSLGDGYREGADEALAWPTPDEMRASARRPGMPRWQGATMEGIASSLESIERLALPLRASVRTAARRSAEVLDAHRWLLTGALASLVAASLCGAAWMLLRRRRPGLWLQTRFDYLRFAMLGLHAPGNAGARQLYAAMERLFALHRSARVARLNAREYLILLCREQGSLRNEARAMIELFERARYSAGTLEPPELERMRQTYRRICQAI